jgi:hypothetical protein
MLSRATLFDIARASGVDAERAERILDGPGHPARKLRAIMRAAADPRAALAAAERAGFDLADPRWNGNGILSRLDVERLGRRDTGDLATHVADLLDIRRGRAAGSARGSGGGWLIQMGDQFVEMGEPCAVEPAEPEEESEGPDLESQVASLLERRRGGRDAIEARRRGGGGEAA